MNRDIDVWRLRMSRSKRRRAAAWIAAEAAPTLNRGHRTVTLNISDRRTLNAFGRRAGSFQPETLRRLEQRVVDELSSAQPGHYEAVAQRSHDGTIEVTVGTR
ncbi:hypothetical protein [Allobranchiibius huperziae]|uniref:Uncharacterized protein n=1 Tax=Allobranchiibius huperziae TaxID=1874116 RepID=A0A853DG96_9MICO|nr:hypothetical protein [Allobranchiibius huperziae]NYJ76566.1 hypothetical protein [Allobranchiibius huperziae]